MTAGHEALTDLTEPLTSPPNLLNPSDQPHHTNLTPTTNRAKLVYLIIHGLMLSKKTRNREMSVHANGYGTLNNPFYW